MSASPAQALNAPRHAVTINNLIFTIREFKPGAAKINFPAIAFEKVPVNGCFAG
jgi:hypothetical protein